tara:strand:+ start:247 stop:696 length:450 start_codon:yes stop_codon:yes gene_type:complete
VSKIFSNKKAYYHYHITDKFEAGLVLKGCEVKSIRQGQLSLAESYVAIKDQEAWLQQCYIAPYLQASQSNLDPSRNRKLLLKRAQLNKIIGLVEKKGMTIMALKIYLQGRRFKCEIGVGKSKNMVDKRQDLKKKMVNREIHRQLKNNHY